MSDLVWTLPDGQPAAEWKEPAAGSLPPGGTTGEVLTKESDADGDAGWEPSGGSIPHTSESLSGNNVSIANGDQGQLTFDTKDLGDDLLDLTDPANPVIVTTGTYVVAVSVLAATMTAGGTFEVALDMDLNGTDNFREATQDSPAAVATNLTPFITVTLAQYMEAGAVVAVFVTNNDGSSAVNFRMRHAAIQRVG